MYTCINMQISARYYHLDISSHVLLHCR